MAGWLSEDFAWKKPIGLEMQECGSPGARWDLTLKKIILCYEIIREFSQLHRNYGQMALVPGTPQMSKNKKIIMAVRAIKNRYQKAFRAERPAR